MEFGNIKILIYLGWVIPVLVVVYFWSGRNKKQAMREFAEDDLLVKIIPDNSADDRMVKLVTIICISMMIFALVRPQWGFFWRENKYEGRDIMIALDTSKSMLATDEKPNRLIFAKENIRDFVRGLKNDRIGIIAFAGEAFVQCPLTVDYSGFMLVLNNISTDLIPWGGTAISSAVTEAVRSYKDAGAEAEGKIMILITDGENTSGVLDEAIKEAKEANVKIYCIGVGTAEGGAIPDLDEEGKETYLKDKGGTIVRSSLDEAALRRIAEATGGMYVKATNSDFGLERIRREKLAIAERREQEDDKIKVPQERFQLFLVLALLLLGADLFFRGRK